MQFLLDRHRAFEPSPLSKLDIRCDVHSNSKKTEQQHQKKKKDITNKTTPTNEEKKKLCMTIELLSQFSVTSKTSMAMCTAITPLWCVETYLKKCCISQ